MRHCLSRFLPGFVFLLVVGISGSLAQAQKGSHPDIVLRGTVQGKQNQTYLRIPFNVPEGVVRLSVSFEYSGKSEHTVLDLGIEDPHRFRGTSGGNKSSFTIGLSDATPSYLPGEIVPGQWKLWIAVPNIRQQSVVSYEADVTFTRKTDPASLGFTDTALNTNAGWYRGDLHMHTGHSDGRCRSQSGIEVPCPVFVTVEAAARRGLDFLAITDHNTTSHYEAERELQPYFDHLLLIPGREVTTFAGHANLFGTTEFLNFAIGTQEVPDVNTLLQNARKLGGLVSINHPNAPSGEGCMGCGWTPSLLADLRLITAVEAVNGGAEEGPYSGVSFWECQLQRGYRLTAIGGSDNHRPQWTLEKVGSVGSPTTVVYAKELSVAGIMDGIRDGHVFVDLTGSRDRLLEVMATSKEEKAAMGDSLRAAAGEAVAIKIHVRACRGSGLKFFLDGHNHPALPEMPIANDEQEIAVSWPSDGRQHWFRADVVSLDGHLQLLGNPVYLNYSQIAAAGNGPQSGKAR